MSRATNRIEILYSLFDNRHDNVPKAFTTNWGAFCKWIKEPHLLVDIPTNPNWAIQQHDVAYKKAKDTDLISPVSYKVGTTRASANVDLVYALAIDIDDGATIDELKTRFVTPDGKPLAYVAYSSFSNRKDNPKWRVIFPFISPVYASEWERYWQNLTHYLVGTHADESAKDVARMYYLPSAPTRHAIDTWSLSQVGEAIDPDVYPEKPKAERKYSGGYVPRTDDDRVHSEVLLNRALEQATLGQRHRACIWLATQARDNKYSELETEQLVSQFARLVPDAASFSEEEGLKVVTHAFTRAPREAWQRRVIPFTSERKYLPSKLQKHGADMLTGEEEEADDDRKDEEHDAEAYQLNMTEMGNAERLIYRHGEDLRYTSAFGWLAWQGDRWHVDDNGETVRRMKHTTRRILCESGYAHREASKATEESQRDKLVTLGKALASWQKRSESDRIIKASLNLATSEPNVYLSTLLLDSDQYLLNCMNGTVNLKTGCLQKHDRYDYCTKQVGCDFDPDALCPQWEKFLARVVPDSVLRDYVQRICGYALTGDVSEQCLFFLYGSGSNGKSTLIKTMLDLLQGYGKQSDAELLLAKVNAGINDNVAALAGKRFVATIEVDEGRAMAEGLMKQLTGGDRITARFLYKNAFEFDPTHKLFLAANHKPVVRNMDFGVWRRIKIIPFTVQIPDDEKDPRLLAKLRQEWPGILAWAVRGCLAWQRSGMNEPASVKESVEEYKAESDTIGQFLSECCVLSFNSQVGATPLYRGYCDWAESRKERPRSSQVFVRQLLENPACERVKKSRSNTGITYEGIALKPEMEGQFI